MWTYNPKSVSYFRSEGSVTASVIFVMPGSWFWKLYDGFEEVGGRCPVQTKEIAMSEASDAFNFRLELM